MALDGSSLPGPDTITRVILSNGIVVLVYENHAAQSVFLIGSLDAGSIHEGPSYTGLASLTASALMRGTQRRDFDAIHEALEAIGADVTISSGSHKVGFSGKALAEDLGTVLDILADVVRDPAFPPEQVERLRGETLTWLQYRQQDTRWQAGRLFRENLYPPEHPYHHSTHGTLETLPMLSVDDLRGFHQDHYGPSGMMIAVAGAVRAQEAVDVIRQRLEDWQNPAQPSTPALPEAPPLADVRRASIAVPGKTQSDLVIGVVGPPRLAADYHAANLVNSILGQFGMMGRIGQVIREELGLAYYAGSRLEGGHGPGAWSVLAGVNPANVELTIERTLEQIRRIVTEHVSDSDLDDNRSYFTGRLPLQLESNEGIASAILNIEGYSLGLDYLVKYRDLIYSLTKDDLLAAAQHYWRTDAYVVSVAGPQVTSERIEEELASS